MFERALGDLEVILGEAIASFERDLFRRGLTRQQQDDRLEQISQAIENNERHKESVNQSSVISAQSRQLIDSDQQGIKEAEAGFLSPEDLAGFAHDAIKRHLPNSMRQTGDGEFELSVTGDLRDALGRLLTTYPATHYARTEIARFRNRVDKPEKTRVSFREDSYGGEFVHARHPLLLLHGILKKRHCPTRRGAPPWSRSTW